MATTGLLPRTIEQAPEAEACISYRRDPRALRRARRRPPLGGPCPPPWRARCGGGAGFSRALGSM
eukprot:12654866-Alexandrium_andersonii.AAC.1